MLYRTRRAIKEIQKQRQLQGRKARSILSFLHKRTDTVLARLCSKRAILERYKQTSRASPVRRRTGTPPACLVKGSLKKLPASPLILRTKIIRQKEPPLQPGMETQRNTPMTPFTAKGLP